MERPTVVDAPGLSWPKRGRYRAAFWVASRKAVRHGYKPARVRLWPPVATPDAPLTADVEAMLKSECHRLQADMLRSFGIMTPAAFAPFDGTFRGLVRSYLSDPDSPYHALRYRSRKLYAHMMGWMADGIGQQKLSAITGRVLKGLFTEWSKPVEDGRRRVARAHYAMSMLRILFGFGASILENAECKRLSDIMSKMEFENVRPRTEVVSREQAIAIRRQAHLDGFPSIALVQAIAWSLGLRQKDIIGEWLPSGEPGLSDVTWHGLKWMFGLHWREVSADLVLTHRLSKSVKGLVQVVDQKAGKTKVYDLRLYPMVMEELVHIPADRRKGPMVIDERTERAYQTKDFGLRWRAIADNAGVPREVQQRDTRAGAATESIEVAGIDAARIGLGHSRAETTMIYNREDARRTAELAVARNRKNEQ